ncbi:hypothetical protein BUE80_DR012924 [Diplocarpon rosae]|nr:hypothetical protein BUE80_DR012924 [Diplocarpon rosae]
MDQPPSYACSSQMRSEDFETASIRSAAPSYASAAPSYTSLLPPTTGPSPRLSSGLPSPYAVRLSLPHSCYPGNRSEPSLHLFCAPAAPALTLLSQANPKARHYHSVASRRASKQVIQERSSRVLSARNGDQGVTQMKKRMEEEELERIKRTSEDPELVGEFAAKEHRRMREESLQGVLEREDKSWDLLLVQINDWEERDKSWKKVRKDAEAGKQGKLAKKPRINGLSKVS